MVQIISTDQPVSTTAAQTTTAMPAGSTAQRRPCGCNKKSDQTDALVKRVNAGITLWHIVLVLFIIVLVRKIFL